MEKPDQEKNQEGPRFSHEQYDMLKRCADTEDVTKWNKWRREHPHDDVMLEGKVCLSHWPLKGIDLGQLRPRSGSSDVKDISRAQVYLKGVVLDGAHMEGANLSNADLTGASLIQTHLEKARLSGTCLQSVCAWNAHFEGAGMKETILNGANLQDAHLEGAMLNGAELRGATLHIASVDASTTIWGCMVNQHSKAYRGTDLSGVALDTVKIDPGTRLLLEYNIRRMNWEKWYSKHRILRWPVSAFWLASDYGLSTWRIIASFATLAFVFGVVYWVCPRCVMVYGKLGDIHGFIHALYFSVVTMTTLGFGDIAANPDSTLGQVLLMLQVILGYVLLGALVTRFAVLFTAGGPAEFADERGAWTRLVERVRRKRRTTGFPPAREWQQENRPRTFSADVCHPEWSRAK